MPSFTSTVKFVSFLLAAQSVKSALGKHCPATSCRYVPSDNCWPSGGDWNSLNKTVSGRLIANVPVAYVCHDPYYNEEECANLQNEWIMPIVL